MVLTTTCSAASEVRPRGQQLTATSDFVHYVIHFAAVREGRACEMCRHTERLEHMHYFDSQRTEAPPVDPRVHI